jgi:hypothetical protein
MVFVLAWSEAEGPYFLALLELQVKHRTRVVFLATACVSCWTWRPRSARRSGAFSPDHTAGHEARRLGGGEGRPGPLKLKLSVPLELRGLLTGRTSTPRERDSSTLAPPASSSDDWSQPVVTHLPGHGGGVLPRWSGLKDPHLVPLPRHVSSIRRGWCSLPPLASHAGHGARGA